MPSSAHQTNVLSTQNSTVSSFNHSLVRYNTNTANWYDPANNFGYGVGRLLRGAFDLAWDTWKSWWNPNPEPSFQEIAQRQHDIYMAGLKECIRHLKSALENVRKNPNDPAILGKMDDLAQHYAAYVNFAPTMELNVYQQRLFQPIREQVERLSDPSLERKLKTLLPVLSIGSPAQERRKTDSSGQGEEYSTALFQSYYEEESTFKKPSELSSLKEKRSIEQILFPAVFDLSTLDGSNGFTIPGIMSSGDLSFSVSSAGDVNGDNVTDLVLGAPSYMNLANNGASYVVFGSRSGFPAAFNLSTLNGSNGFTIPGIVAGGQLGESVSSAGDLNGDGIADLVLGAFNSNSGNGVSYVLFGSRSSFPAVFNLNTLNGSNGFTIPGIASGGFLGNSISTTGDVNGDTITDLVLAAWYANSFNGTSYVLFGSRSSFPAIFDLTTLNGSNGFSVPGIASSGYLGASVSAAGDVNGDTIADLVLGADGVNSYTGASYVIFGSRSGFPAVFDLTTLNGSNGFTIPGIASRGFLGISARSAGDVNADNVTDLVLGAYGANTYTGASYVIFGSRSGFPAIFNLSTLNGSNGFIISGLAYNDGLGNSVSTAGDVNGDTITDLMLGASGANSNNGTSYMIFGSRNGFPAVFNLNTLNGSNGFSIPGIANGGRLGNSVSTAGDVNGDNISDLVLGAAGANSYNGTSYVVFGRNTFSTPISTSTPTSPIPAPMPTTPTPIPSPTQAPTLVQVGTIDWVIQANGTTVLTPTQFQVLGNSTQLANDIFIVDVSQGGYFATSTNLTVALTNFTFPQIEAGQILFVHQGTQLPNITLSIGDGSGQLVLFSPLISFFNTQPSNQTPLPIGVIAGVTGGIIATAAGAGILFFMLKKSAQERKIAQFKGQIEKVQGSEIEDNFSQRVR